MSIGPTIYILGAGCSCDFGYPLAKDFVQKLEMYAAQLGRDSQFIKQCAEETVRLMRQVPVLTVDDLVAKIESGIFDDPRSAPEQKYPLRDQRIRAAKIATEALFLSLEPAARRTGLKSYLDLLHELFPGNAPWQAQLRSTTCRVLTFDCDRLFEIAFLSRFPVNIGQHALYGPEVLNSGLAIANSSLTEFTPDRFSFLKLHGSIGRWYADHFHRPHFFHAYPSTSPENETVMSDAYFDFLRAPAQSVKLPEMLIVFPNEKQEALSESRSQFLYRPYIEHVWRQAASLVAAAQEIRVIGYSFAAPDIADFLKLLRLATHCERIIVHNPDAVKICDKLKLDNELLARKLRPHPYPF